MNYFLQLRSVLEFWFRICWIIYPSFSICRKIHWDHRSLIDFCGQEFFQQQLLKVSGNDCSCMIAIIIGSCTYMITRHNSQCCVIDMGKPGWRLSSVAHCGIHSDHILHIPVIHIGSCLSYPCPSDRIISLSFISNHILHIPVLHIGSYPCPLSSDLWYHRSGIYLLRGIPRGIPIDRQKTLSW